MTIILRPKRSFTIPIEAECVTPDVFVGKSTKEIASLKIWEGNKERDLGELFSVEETKNTQVSIQIRGDVSKVRRIGVGMSLGEIIINGDVGMHLGEEMKGGNITVTGNAGSWAGSMMREGTIEIGGNVGDYVGAPYRGSTSGMNGGTIVVQGNAGNELGCFMRKGLIKVNGNVDQFCGVHMLNGTIYVQGNSGERAGAEMLGGRIVICGIIPSVLPTFMIDEVRPSVRIDKARVTGPFYRFIGDIADRGEGRLFVSKTQNTHLKFLEKYL